MNELQLKDKLREILLKQDYERVRSLGEPYRIVKYLISFSYDKSQPITWRSIEAMGVFVASVSAHSPEFGRLTLRRLFWSITDESGGIGWSAPEMIGEIVRNDPEKYPDIPQILWANIDEEFLQKGIIWAVGRIAESSPELVHFSIPELQDHYVNAVPDVKLYAAWALCKFGIVPELTPGSKDMSTNIYEDGQYKKVSLNEIVSKCKSDKIKE